MLGAPVHAYRVFLGRGRDRRDRLVKEFRAAAWQKFRREAEKRSAKRPFEVELQLEILEF